MQLCVVLVSEAIKFCRSCWHAPLNNILVLASLALLCCALLLVLLNVLPQLCAVLTCIVQCCMTGMPCFLAVSLTVVSAECLVNSVSACLLLESSGISGLSVSCPCQVTQNKPVWQAQTCSARTSPSAFEMLLLLQVGKADSTAMTNGRAALALLSQWMMTHQGSMWHRKSTSAADAYAAGKLRLTWLDASKC